VRYYHARISREYKESKSVKCLLLFTRSLDLSPIENLWNKLKSNITKRHHRIKGISDMEQVLREE
jgi:transposase